ncbi:3-oxo-tetronate 4-phosphate decarboxylase [Pleomorphomonas carboxyditropha]|uniref:3-oxo-tetronate 4-phosphate decarboxylase n=1 Tax=Pleomorphomonas carboxyditropha TaxID=2023338 RepID=A0A2G9WXH6_9HYPH|nr:3-oxo-tetronate 4-phosphate decarboxylase [Pleomorphomonas carboxyditropha]PIO99418.1 aldolase [Pleomorphomonas carboxyditropha]
MIDETELRRKIVDFAGSFHRRGLTHGSSGNISARLDDGGLVMTPTGSSFGTLDAGRLSRLDADGNHIGGDRPTKEIPLHRAFYASRPGTGAVVHLHSPFATAFSMLSDVDPGDALPPLTPYSIMLLGKVRLLPYFRPGSPAIGEAIAALAGSAKAVLLANHGPIVVGRTLEDAVNAMEELEATARLFFLTRDCGAKRLTPAQVEELAANHGAA